MTIRLGTIALLSALGVTACGGGTMQPDTESNTNWLEMCTKDADCDGDSRCLCGTCTKACDDSDECGGVAKSAECIETTMLAAGCNGEAPVERICAVTCDEDSGCGGPLECQSDRCVAPPRPGDGVADGLTCQSGSVVAEIAVTNVDNADLLFVVDNTPTMAPAHAKLRAELPRLVKILTSGEDTDKGLTFPPVNSLHVAVVTSDMGTPGIEGVPNCSDFGDDGVFRTGATSDDPNCPGAPYPEFLTFTSDNDPQADIGYLACALDLDGQGCGYPQPLEAGLKALWPDVDIDPNTGLQWVDPQTGRPSNRIRFLGVDGEGELGHGNGLFPGFLRNDAATGLSVISVVVVTNQDDCSSTSTAHMVPADQLPSDSPLAAQSESLRCYYNQENLYNVQRYVQGLRALRPGNENLVMFSAITGVPEDLVAPEQVATVDFSNDQSRNRHYDSLLSDPRMLGIVDRNSDDGTLAPACSGADISATPGRRLVEVARDFGANGSVHSICGDSFAGAIDGVVEIVSKQLGAVCLPRQLLRKSDGLVPCDVTWQLPLPNTAPASTPTKCSRVPFLSDSGRTEPDGRPICLVDQVGVTNGGLEDGTGWYYDDFSKAAQRDCVGLDRQRIAFTPEANPPTGVIVQLECETSLAQGLGDACKQDSDCQEQLVCVADTCQLDGGFCPAPAANDDSNLGRACAPRLVPEFGFDEREAYLETGNPDCGGNACLVFELRGDTRESCVPTDGRVCAGPTDLQDRVYCSCRCDGEGVPEDELCDCADGFSCVPILSDKAPSGGSYCVRNSTISR